MNKKRSTIAVALAFSFALAFLLVDREVSYAEETRIVRIHGGESFNTKSLRLEPETLRVGPGSVVVWNNWARASEVKIIFEEGKLCQNVTEASMGFKLDAKQCYVTQWTPLGGTSSLRFIERGNYKYAVENRGGLKSVGNIVVK